MTNVGRYREGIEKSAQALTVPSARTPAKKAAPLAEEAAPSSPDYVVELGSLKKRAQDLIESGFFDGSDLDYLKKFVSEA